jgi:hypothetical protein
LNLPPAILNLPPAIKKEQTQNHQLKIQAINCGTAKLQTSEQKNPNSLY